MGEVLARVVTVGSIVLTVASLALAVVFARKRSRIRVGFDLARAIIGILAILVMAVVTGVATSTIAVLLAVFGGLALGFGQGSKLEITRDAKGFHARRSPVAIALWGAGIVVMQAAGLASRSGVVRLGQTIAWFSACLGIGLMVGRTGPLKQTAAGATAAAAIIAVILPTAFVVGTNVPVAAQSITLTDEQMCDLTPDDWTWHTEVSGVEGILYTYSAISSDGEMLTEGIVFGPKVPDALVGCANNAQHYPDGANIDVGVLLMPSAESAAAVVTRIAAEASSVTPDVSPLAVTYSDENAAFPTNTMVIKWPNEHKTLWLGSRGPFVVVGTAEHSTALDDGRSSVDVLVERMLETIWKIDQVWDSVVVSTTAPIDGTVVPTTAGATGDTVLPPGSDGGDASRSGSGASDEPIGPEEAAGQAIAGVIAAAAIGLITWGEASGEITRILAGLGGSGNGTPPKPSVPPPPPPPMLDEDGNPMTISSSTTRDAAGTLVPPGMVEWVAGYGEVSWIPREEAIARVEAEKAARRENEEWLGRRAAEADTTWMDQQREQADARRAAEEREAAERAAERQALDAWGRRIEGRDALDRRQSILEADSARKSSSSGWWDNFNDEYRRGVSEDVAALPGEMYDATGDAIRWVHGELTDPENWQVAGETMWDSARDLGGLVVGDRGTVERVSGDVEAGAEAAGRVAGALWDAAKDDPAGAAVGVVKAVLGADNWEKVIDKSVPVSERLGRAIWGVFDTGGTLMGAGAGAIKALDTVGDAARAVDAVGDAARAVDAVGDAARLGDATADAARVGDAFGDTARGTGVLDDAVRVSDDAVDAARAGDAVSDTGKVPGYATDSVDDIRHLPEGAEITDPRLIEQTGYSQPQIAGMRNLAEKENVIIGARTTNIDSVRHIREGRAMPKPIEIKSKTINELDTFLGANPRDKGLVGYFEPKRPDLSKVPDNLHADVLSRYDARMSEYRKLSGDIDVLVQRGDLFPDKVRGILVDSRTGLPYAGDIDPVFFKDATTGKYLSADRYLEVVEKFKRSGAMGQHGAEVNVVGDLTMGKELGSPEWREAYEKALELQRKLEKGHISGSETVVQMGPDGILRRGPRFETGLPTVERSRPMGFNV